MTPQQIESAFRRIVVAIDPSGGARDVLAAAARLAARQEAELLGLFVEDTDVLTLASLPFAREFGLSSVPRAMDPLRIESEVRAQAALVERWMAGVAQELGLSWSFEIRRGRYESEVLACLSQADLLVLGRGRQQDVGGEMGLVARVLATEAAPSILLVAPGDEGQRAGPVAVRYDGSPAAASALATASRFLVPDGDAIVVLLEAQGSAERREREETARSHLKSLGLAGVVRHLSQPGAEGIAQALRAERARLLVMAVSDRPSDARLVADLARVSRTPVLLVPGLPAPGPS